MTIHYRGDGAEYFGQGNEDRPRQKGHEAPRCQQADVLEAIAQFFPRSSHK
jgi:hypothetical protein